MDKRIFWIWLQNAFGPGSAKPKQIVSRVGSPEAFWDGGVALWSSFSFVTDRELTALSDYGPEKAAALLQYCLALGQKVITPDCREYPPLLKEIPNPPCVLYVSGNMPAFDTLWVGVVGTRRAGELGLHAARTISHQLAAQEAVIVSGGAVGIDSEAHQGALRAGGKTAVFLPCGLDYPYLMDNALMRREIVDAGGAMITEFPTNTPVQRGAFQIRNRLISGVSHVVFVPEAPKKSGALLTADYAMQQNRDVFVYIGEDKKAFEGCEQLLNVGAKQAFSAEEILTGYRNLLRRTPAPVVKAEVIVMEEAREKSVQMLADSSRVAEEGFETALEAAEEPSAADFPCSETAAAVYAALNDTPQHASVLEEKTGLPMADLLAALTELELFGLIRTFPGQRFTKE